MINNIRSKQMEKKGKGHFYKKEQHMVKPVPVLQSSNKAQDSR